MPSEDVRRIVETLKVAMAIADAKGVITYANSASAQLVGRELVTLTNLDMGSLFADTDRKRILQNVGGVGEGKAGSAFVDAELDTRARGARWVQMAFQPALDARDKAAGVVAVLRDIGPERETEHALNLSAARLLAFAEASPVAVMIENAAGDIELANAPFCRLLGLNSAPQSLTGVPVHDALAQSTRIEPKAIERARKKPRDAATFTLRIPEGRTLTLERQPLSIEEMPAGALWSPREEAAEASGGAKGAAQIALIEKIGMELSVAMEGISAISIRAQQMEFDPAMVDHFQRIRTSTETAMAAIGDLGDFSKMSGVVVLHNAKFGLPHPLPHLAPRLPPHPLQHHPPSPPKPH